MNVAIANLLSFIFSLLASVFLLRMLLQLARANFTNPFSQMIFNVTTPVVRPMQIIFPTIKRFNLAATVTALLVVAIDVVVKFFFITGAIPGPVAILKNSLVGLLLVFVHLLLFLILIRVVMSWINPGQYNPILAIIYQVTDLFLKPIQRVIPSLGGIDFSPMVLLLIVFFIRDLVIHALA